MFYKLLNTIGIILLSLNFILLSNVMACESDTIDTIVSNIDPYRNSAPSSVESALLSLSLCTENYKYAGLMLGRTIDAYRDTTCDMSRKMKEASDINEAFARGLALGMIESVDPYRDTTYCLVDSIVGVVERFPNLGKEAALALGAVKDDSRGTIHRINRSIAKMVSIFRNKNSLVEPSSSWIYKVEPRTCEEVFGPWDYSYYPCPDYYTYAADEKGTIIQLSCSPSEENGIYFEMKMSQDIIEDLERVNLQTISFGMDDDLQILGQPYLVDNYSTIIGELPLADNVITGIRQSNELQVQIRADRGERKFNYKFPLNGSNNAIKKLLKACSE